MAAETSDTEWVRSQLIDAAEVRARRFCEPRPFGSTVVLEQLAEAELLRPWVTVEVETETLPVDVEATGIWNDVELRLRFFAPQVFRGRVTYSLELVPPAHPLVEQQRATN